MALPSLISRLSLLPLLHLLFIQPVELHCLRPDMIAPALKDLLRLLFNVFQFLYISASGVINYDSFSKQYIWRKKEGGLSVFTWSTKFFIASVLKCMSSVKIPFL